jgi:transcriptional regulator with PAS, ATPase and Fis domain
MYREAVTPSVQPSTQPPGIVGDSVAIREILDVVKQVGPTDITVLISGESGVGKDVVAKAVHASSNRARKPLITVNSGAIPEGIIESELFGHERGSFTGASEQRKGYFELADGGTIFLDEIGELPLPAQVKFLRVLENGEYLRVGSSVPRKVDVRVIAATNKDLEAEVRHGRFRQDLYYRLRSVNIVIPPLRSRPEDIPALVSRFAAEIAVKNGIRFEGITDVAMEALKEYGWPGNVRELRNVVESMIVLERGKKIKEDDVRRYVNTAQVMPEERHLPVHVAGKSVEQAERELILRALLDIKTNLLELKDIFGMQAGGMESDRRTQGGMAVGQPSEEANLSLDHMERRMIAEALERHKGNRRVAARVLNISERTLYRKIKEYGLG